MKRVWCNVGARFHLARDGTGANIDAPGAVPSVKIVVAVSAHTIQSLPHNEGQCARRPTVYSEP